MLHEGGVHIERGKELPMPGKRRAAAEMAERAKRRHEGLLA